MSPLYEDSMRVTRIPPLTLMGVALVLSLTARAEEAPFRVPDGFAVSKFAGNDLTHDTWAMTIDSKGRVAVAGPSCIKVLLDSDEDGIAERAHPVTREARNAHGLLFAGNDLLSVQQHGIFRHRDHDGDGLPEGPPELLYQLPGVGGEHGAHGIRQGPDGWFYLACGNNTKIGTKQITTATPPIAEPSQGTVLRVSPDGRQSEVIAHGFRNHYDLAFNKHGHLFTFDSDGERDHQLPWYSYCRVFHVRVGGHHGWLPGHQRSFNRPPCFFDSVDRLVEVDRGSPTGVEVYRHTQFPEKYRDGLFYACWTYGRVYFAPLVAEGGSYQPQKPVIFLETTGNLGFAPTDLAVHPPTGDLFVSVGGRGTQGAVYRVSYPAGRREASAQPLYETPKDWSIHAQAIKPTEPLSPAAALALFKKDAQPASRLTALRHLMLALGDISTSEAKRRIDAGYSSNEPDKIDPGLREEVLRELTLSFSSGEAGHRELNYEIARLLAMLRADAPAAVATVAAALTPLSHPTDDAHFLFCLTQMPGVRDGPSRSRIARAFLAIDQKLESRKLLTDRNWTINIRDALQAHLELDPGLGKALPAGDSFGHPAHAYLLNLLPAETALAGARRMLGQESGWNAGALSLIQAQLPAEEILPRMRQQWQHPQFRPLLTGFLSTHGNEDDKKRVEEFRRPPAAGIDLAPFAERMKQVDWAQGDRARGEEVYARYTCVVCHSENTRLGPHLKGIARRFNRDDLFRHINEPNLAISDLYKATQITTREGTYVGVKVYDSEAQTILETGAGETIRFSRHDILSERQPNQSPMPPGLLLAASTRDLADLYAYLKALE